MSCFQELPVKVFERMKWNLKIEAVFYNDVKAAV